MTNVNTKNKNFLKFFQDDSELNEIHEQLRRNDKIKEKNKELKV